MKKIILVFSPHPDDETLGCGGTIAKKISENWDIYVVILTDGRFSHLIAQGIIKDPSPEEVRQIRKNEVINALSILGVPIQNISFLDIIDGTLRKEYDAIKPEITKIILKYKPDEVYVPYRYDSHSDHIITNNLVYNTITDLDIYCKIFEYSITNKHGILGPIIDKIKNIFINNMKYIDISQYLHLKNSALNEFRSQEGLFLNYGRSENGSFEKENRYEIFYSFIEHSPE